MNKLKSIFLITFSLFFTVMSFVILLAVYEVYYADILKRQESYSDEMLCDSSTKMFYDLNPWRVDGSAKFKVKYLDSGVELRFKIPARRKESKFKEVFEFFKKLDLEDTVCGDLISGI